MTNASNLQSSVQDLFIKYAPAAIAICDTQMRYLAHSDRWSRDYGLEGENLVGQCHYDLFSDLPESWKEEHQRCFEGEIIRKEEEPFPRVDGKLDWVRRELHPWKDSNGKIGGLVMFTEVVTKRRQAQIALKESEKEYRRLMENAVMGIYQVHRDGKFLMVNRRMAEMFGFDSPKAFLENVHNIKNLYLDPLERPKILKEIDREGFVQRKEVAYKKPGGDTIWIHLNTRRTRNNAGEVLYEGLVEDITELKQAREEKERFQERFLRTQKTRAIVDLAGGIAHQFNNALVGISGNVELLKMNYSDDAEILPYLNSMMKASNRMAHLTRQLLAYARGGNYQARTLSLPEFLKESLPILKHGLNDRIRIEMDVPGDIHLIHGDPIQLQMVLSAALNNGAEAIEDQGRITIKAENHNVDETRFEKETQLKSGPHVCLTIEDDGKGMAPESLASVFDPFFTTKFQGRGMGMAAAYGIVRNHGGWISVESEPQKGTRVSIWLPALPTEKK